MSVDVMCSPKMKAHSLPHIQQNPAAEYSEEIHVSSFTGRYTQM